jgi:hypothetical protein
VLGGRNYHSDYHCGFLSRAARRPPPASGGCEARVAGGHRRNMQPCQGWCRGSDGGRYRVRYTPGLGPGYLPAVVRDDRAPSRRRADAVLGPSTSGLASGSGGPGGLRERARRLGVSHEAVRQAVRAVGRPTDPASRNRAIREMAINGATWPGIAQASGMSPSGVRFACRDLPPRRAGRPWHETTDEAGARRHRA